MVWLIVVGLVVVSLIVVGVVIVGVVVVVGIGGDPVSVSGTDTVGCSALACPSGWSLDSKNFSICT